jgi:hypothetical protein
LLVAVAAQAVPMVAQVAVPGDIEQTPDLQ